MTSSSILHIEDKHTWEHVSSTRKLQIDLTNRWSCCKAGALTTSYCPIPKEKVFVFDGLGVGWGGGECSPMIGRWARLKTRHF